MGNRNPLLNRAGAWRSRALALVAVPLLALGACTSIELALGLKTRLDKVPVSGLSARLDGGPALAPGGSARLIIVATTADGKQLVTGGPGHGTVLFDSFTYSASVVQVDKRGRVSLPEDPRLSQGKLPHVHIVTNGHPDVVADLDVPVRYDMVFHANFSGAAGDRGFDGLNGMDGMAGSSGSADLNNPSAGGNGSNGTDGTDGGNGGPGGSGDAVHVWIRLLAGEHPLLQVRAASSARERLFLVDPAGGSLAIDASGGPGGQGGSGGRGGRGGLGGVGWPNGSSGFDGRNGFDGSPGVPGDPGSFVVSVDPSAQPYLDHLKLVNRGGFGGDGPPPEIRVEPVAPIW